MNNPSQQFSSSTVGTIGSVSSGISEKVDCLNHEANKTKDDQLHVLIQIFKELGIKLLDAPTRVLRSIKEANLEATEISPEFFMSFLKSYNATGMDTCQLGRLDCSIEETTFKTCSNLQLCISYCQQSKLFGQQLHGLPFCLTEDGILRTFKRDNPVFCTKSSTILTKSACLFLHHDLIDRFTITFDGLKQFDINAFAEFLPTTLSSEVFRTHNKPVARTIQLDSVPNMTWLSLVWDFIDHTVTQNVDKSVLDGSPDGRRNLDSVVEMLYPLMPWCLIPCTQSVQPFEANTIEHEEIRNRNITQDVCTNILEFFSEHIDRISENDNVEALLNKIIQIPLHVNVNGHNISLDSNARVLVLDDNVSEKIILDGVENEIVWYEFLYTAGIQTQVTPKLVLKFARSIEEEAGRKGVTKEISKKSKKLTKHILSRPNIENEGILNEISYIKFIVPCQIIDWKNKIFPQKHDLTVCYRESVPSYKADLCWTTCNIIPDKAKPYYSQDHKKQQSVVSQLGILNEPPFRSVISHVQNICDVLKVSQTRTSSRMQAFS
ncbi:unnamed protein product [Mytilus edulis]|uniref:Uncharacterized protein n=1 Tax=Mytilus edulis TaxID=6550 RepID=A0A8S3V4M8_MYTED|nr:unnamed protein product [Mytilus edulis]